MRKIRAERPSNPQQNHLGVESNASLAADGGMMADPVRLVSAATDRAGGIAMRAVSFFGPGWPERIPAGFGRGCKTGEAVTCAGNSGGRRNGSFRYSAGGSALSDDAGGDRSGRMTGVVSGFWGSAGSAMTNHVVPAKIAEISFAVTR
jgi:hypothetical protein